MTKQYKVTVDGTIFDVTLERVGIPDRPSAPAPMYRSSWGDPAPVSAPAPVAAPVSAPAPAPVAAPAPAPVPAPVASGTQITSPLPGTVLNISVSEGQAVKSGDVLFLLEAMKMENEVMSPCDGTVASIHVAKGAAVDPGTLLCVIR